MAMSLVDVSYLNKHKPEPGGYYVRYEDGYESYSPPEAFEAGYTRIAADWRGRVEEEKRALDENIRKLENFLKIPVGLPSPDAIRLLNRQLSFMRSYSQVLAERLQEKK